MSTKPTIALARFADTGGADVTAPSSGLRDTGFVAGTPISQSFVNELFKQGYLWDQYLNDGALTGNHTITGTLGVSSALTVTSGGLVVSAGGAAITGTLAVTGGATISTTLGVTGAATVGGTLGVTGDVTVGGDIYRNNRIKLFNGASAIPATNVTQNASGSASGTAAATFTIPMDGFEVGDRLKSVTFKAKGSAAGTLTASLSTGSGTSSSSSPAQTGVSVPNPPATDTDYTVTITSPTALTVSDGAWFLTAQISSAGTLAITNIRATYDHPPP